MPSKSIAVLPFLNMSPSEENEYFSDGITEEIINALAKINGLKVTSRTSSFFFKGKNLPITEIGRELRVSTILEGSVRLAGNTMRITAQLIDVEEDFHFWSETFDRSVEDIFAVQDEISLLIADKLREHLGHFEFGDHLVESLGIPAETYQKYLKGRFHLMKLTLPETEIAIEIFKEVIAEQPDFALPYLAINQGYSFLGTMGQLPASEAFAKARPYLEKALELDADLPESQLNLAWIACWQNWDLESAYRHINRALEIRPTDEIYLTISNFLTVEGKLDAAHTYIDKALTLDPLSAINHHYKGFLHYLGENFEEAEPWLEKSLALKPELPFPHIYLGVGLLLRGRKEEALDFFLDLAERPTGDLTKLGGTTLAQAALGKHQEVEEGMARLEAALQTDAMGSAMNFLVQVHTLLGSYGQAFQLIEQAIDLHLPNVLLFRTEPVLKPLRSQPRFQELMAKLQGQPVKSGLSRGKYKKSLLKPAQLEEQRRKLQELMEEKQPYLDPGLSLRSLAQMLDLPANHLSQLLNEGFDRNFSEYVNAFRLETFKAKAADPQLRQLTILALAYDSGFNSKTVFNTYFKKMTGKTPSAYWKEVVR